MATGIEIKFQRFHTKFSHSLSNCHFTIQCPAFIDTFTTVHCTVSVAHVRVAVLLMFPALTWSVLSLGRRREGIHDRLGAGEHCRRCNTESSISASRHSALHLSNHISLDHLDISLLLSLMRRPSRSLCLPGLVATRVARDWPAFPRAIAPLQAIYVPIKSK